MHRTPHVVWMQLGIVNEEAAERVRRAGLTVIMDKCMMIEHKRLAMGDDDELEQIRVRKMRELINRIGGPKADARKYHPGVPVTVEDATFDQTVQQYPLMVIDCWAPWCGPCRMVAPVIDEMTKDYTGRVAFGKLNVDENPETAMRFGIQGIPTLLFIKNGKEVNRIVGAAPRWRIEAELRKHL